MTQILISSSVLIVVLALLRKLLRGKVSFRLQYALWLLVALRLLVPVPIGQSDYSVTSLSSSQTQTAQRFLDRPLPKAAPQSAPQKPLGQPASPNPAGAQMAQPVPQERVQDVTVGQVLKLVWLLGVGCMVIWFFAVNLRFRRRARKNAQWIPLQEFPLPVYLTTNIPSACLVGLFRPRVYLTEEAAQDDRTMRHVLTHERMHYRHGDSVWALVRSACLCIYWFDPLVWWAASLSRQDGELACDESVLRRLGEAERIPYGKTLVGMIAQAGRAEKLLQTATTMKATKQQMKERVQMIAAKPKRLIAALICLLLIVTLTAACTFAGAKAETPDTPSEIVPESAPTEPERTGAQTAPVMEYYSSADGTFRIPQLALESGDASFDNARILETFGENEGSSDFICVDYTWAQNGPWVSLVVRGTKKDTGETVRLVSNLSWESGAALTKEELYGSAFDSASDYDQQLELALSTYFAKELREILLASPEARITECALSPALAKELEDAFLASPETMPLELVIDAFYETVYDDNRNGARLWLDENGDLWCCATVYLPQGGAQERELRLTGPTEAEPYDTSVSPKVIELYSSEGRYTQSDSTPYGLHIPFLLVSGAYASQVNGEILRTFLCEGVSGSEYTWAVNGDILSIAVRGDGYGKLSRAANVDLRDGSPVSQDAIFGMAGLTGAEYRTLAKQALVNRLFASLPKEGGYDTAQIDALVAETEKEENLSAAVPYLDGEGKLWICGGFPSPDGEGYSQTLIPLTDMEFLPDYLEYMGQ